ncbi:hypothetical protein EON65_27580, partial [archaeon]
MYEGRPEIYLLHDGNELLLPGDIIRIGNVMGRDYLVSAVGSRTDQTTINNKVIYIDPEYDLLNEPDFQLPITKNAPWPIQGCGVYMIEYVKPVKLLKEYGELGYDYGLPEEIVQGVEKTTIQFDTLNRQKEDKKSSGDMEATNTALSTQPKGRSKRKAHVKRAFKDVWVWKCIPSKDDNRPKWRRMYDDGLVHYGYEYRNTDDCLTHFRVKAHLAYLEVLCTDSRVPSLSYHHQRIHEMASIPLEFYLRTAFDRMTTEWQPIYKKGVERAKFIKLLKEVQAFPDMKRPTRVNQLDAMFTKIVKGEYGIVQKYITYPGFVQLLKEVALVRFPYRKKKTDGDDDASVGSTKKAGGGGGGDDDSTTMTDEMSSLGGDDPPPFLKKSISKSSLTRKASMMRATSMSSLSSKKSVKGGAGAGRGAGKSRLMVIGEDNDEVDPDHLVFAYQKFLFDYIMMYPNWYEPAWKEAKLTAMKKEALPYCAATRLQAVFRGFSMKKKFKEFITQHTKLQANIRRKLSAKKTLAIRRLYWEDWCFRLRYYYATRINAWIRRFNQRCWYHHVLEQIKRQQVIMLKARRQRLRKLRQAEKKTIIYNEAVRVNGLMVFIKLMRKDPRNYTKDYGIIIHVYVPLTQQTFKFMLEDAELRNYMAIELELDVVTVGQLMDIRNLKKLMSSRLIVHKASSKNAKPAVILSKHALGQKGENALTRAIRIRGQMFICKVFETVEEIAVQCYHTISSKIFTVRMGSKEMRQWTTEEYILEGGDKQNDPPILHNKHKRAYHNWIINHLAIDTRRGQFKVVFACHLLKSQKREMVIRIQSIWRRALVRPIIIRMLDYVMLKVYATPGDPATVYYLNKYTGASGWVRPKLLGNSDIPTQPISKWVEIYYEDAQGIVRPHYVNPYTGFYTHLVPEQAARIIQTCARNYLLKTISMPKQHFVKAGSMYKTAAKKYEQKNAGGALKLSAVINLAICNHVVDLEEDQAKELYRQAVELSEVNPLVTRCYAFYLIGSCVAPTGLNRERASVLLRDADRKDPSRGSFTTAYYIFQFAVLRQPYEVKTLLNLALVQCHMYPDTKSYVAEKLLRRALALQPFDERVMEIWKLLRDRFPERQLLYSSMLRKTTVDASQGEKQKIIHGREVFENRRWAGWVYVAKDTFNVSKRFGGANRPYWYNP